MQLKQATSRYERNQQTIFALQAQAACIQAAINKNCRDLAMAGAHNKHNLVLAQWASFEAHAPSNTFRHRRTKPTME